MSLFKKVLHTSPAYQAVKLARQHQSQKPAAPVKLNKPPVKIEKPVEVVEPVHAAPQAPKPIKAPNAKPDTVLVMPLKGRGDKLVADNISSDENILVKLQGDFGQALVMTNKRLYIVKWGFQSGTTFGGKCIAYEYRNISAIESKKHMTTRLIQVLTPANQDKNLSYWGERGNGNNAIESDSAVTYKAKLDSEFQEAINIARRVIEKAHGASSGGGLSDVEQLEKLAELKDRGIITDTEFQAKKRQLLGL